MGMALQFLICVALLGFIPEIQCDDCNYSCNQDVNVCDGKGFKDWNQKYGFVNLRTGAYMFYWMFLANNVKTIKEAATYPLVIWLQGGPGGGSTGFGNFFEIGPYDEHLKERNTTWAKYVNLLFIDNPVGAGYSFVLNETYLTSTNSEIVADLLTFTKTFYSVFPEFKKTPLYVFSESYGGKMTVEYGYELNKAITAGKVTANLAGLGLGDAWISPVDSVLSWAPYLYNTGVIDEEGYKTVDKIAQRAKKALDSGLFAEATNAWENLEDEIYDETSGVDFYNILTKMTMPNTTENNAVTEVSDNDIMNKEVRKALNIDEDIVYGEQSDAVFNNLWPEFMKPVTDIVAKLLNETQISVVVYNGQLDLIVDTPGTLAWVDNLKWSDINKWKNATRKPLVVDNIIEGYSKKYGKFSFYWINRAGHMAPADNTQAGLKILKEVTGLK